MPTRSPEIGQSFYGGHASNYRFTETILQISSAVLCRVFNITHTSGAAPLYLLNLLAKRGLCKARSRLTARGCNSPEDVNRHYQSVCANSQDCYFSVNITYFTTLECLNL